MRLTTLIAAVLFTAPVRALPDSGLRIIPGQTALVVISPHYYPHDEGWRCGGLLEKLMHGIDMFERKGPLAVAGIGGPGADWLPRHEPFVEDEENVVTSPHKIYGPEANSLVLQLRKRGVDWVIPTGMSANLCVESHQQGFQVAVVRDATAAARVPEGDGDQAAPTNFRFIANDVPSTDEAAMAMAQAAEARTASERNE